MGASRWYFFRRVTFPLLMPTTLFVLVNAVINSFRLVDHIVVMTKGGPDNATVAPALLHLRRRLQVLGPGLRGGADAGAAGDPGRGGARPVPAPGPPGALPVTRPGRALETAGAWLLGVLWVLPLAYAVWTAFHPSEFSTRFVPTAPLTLENFVKAWAAAPFARYFVNTIAAGHHDPGRPARALHARGLRLRALRLPRAATSRSCSCWCSS